MLRDGEDVSAYLARSQWASVADALLNLRLPLVIFGPEAGNGFEETRLPPPQK